MYEGVDGRIFNIYHCREIRCQLRQESEYIEEQVEDEELTFGYGQEAKQNDTVSMPTMNIVMNITD